MRTPIIRTIVKASGVALVFVTVVWAGVSTPSPDARGGCLAEADVMRYQHASRSGISLTCNEEIRARNASERSAS